MLFLKKWSKQHIKSRATLKLTKVLTAGIKTLTLKHFFQSSEQALIRSDNDKHYGVADCLVLEQGPNYALAKRIQQWRAILAHQNGQRVSINIAPSTTTHSVTKNPILKAAFNGASLFDVEAFAPETTNAIMAALWVHDLRNDECAANPHTSIDHPLELMMEGANHGVCGVLHIWHVLRYLLRRFMALPRINCLCTGSKIKKPVKLTGFFLTMHTQVLGHFIGRDHATASGPDEMRGIFQLRVT